MRDIKAILPSQICNAEESASGVSFVMDKRNISNIQKTLQQRIGGATIIINLTLGYEVFIELDQNCTISLGSFFATAGTQSVLMYVNPVTYTVTWGDSITWDGGAPSLSASSLNVVRLWTVNNWQNIYGELLATSLSAPDMSVIPDTYAGWSLASSGLDVVQFNVATETSHLVLVDAFSDDTLYYRPREGTASTNPIRGVAYVIGGRSSEPQTDRYGYIYGYAVNCVSLWGSVAPNMVRNGPPHSMVDWFNEYANSYVLANNGVGASGVSNTLNTLHLFSGAYSYNSVLLSSNYTMVLSGKLYGYMLAPSPTATNYSRLQYSSGAVTNFNSFIGSYRNYNHAGAAHDPSTEIGYLLGGDDNSSDRALLKVNTSSNSFTLVSTTAMPSVVAFARGYAQSADYVWGYRTSGSFKLTIATESVAVMSDGSYPLTAGPIIPSNSMVI